MKKNVVSLAVLGAFLAVGSQACIGRPTGARYRRRTSSCSTRAPRPSKWVTKKSDHSGSSGLKKGESCAGCHDEKPPTWAI